MKLNEPDLLNKLKQLVCENTELQCRLETQTYICNQKTRELDALKFAVVINTEANSNLDNKVMELELLQDCLDTFQQQRSGDFNREKELQQELDKSIFEHHQLQDLRAQYICLEIKCNDLQYQLDNFNHGNLLSNQQNNLMVRLKG